jgi:hypothetical protein
MRTEPPRAAEGSCATPRWHTNTNQSGFPSDGKVLANGCDNPAGYRRTYPVALLLYEVPTETDAAGAVTARSRFTFRFSREPRPDRCLLGREDLASLSHHTRQPIARAHALRCQRWAPVRMWSLAVHRPRAPRRPLPRPHERARLRLPVGEIPQRRPDHLQPGEKPVDQSELVYRKKSTERGGTRLPGRSGAGGAAGSPWTGWSAGPLATAATSSISSRPAAVALLRRRRNSGSPQLRLLHGTRPFRPIESLPPSSPNLANGP